MGVILGRERKLFGLPINDLTYCRRTLTAARSVSIPLRFWHVLWEASEDGFVDPLGLAACLRMVRCSRSFFDSKYCGNCCKKSTYKLGVVVGQQVRRFFVWDEPLVHEYNHNVRSCRLRCRDCPREPGVAFFNNKNVLVTLRNF